MKTRSSLFLSLQSTINIIQPKNQEYLNLMLDRPGARIATYQELQHVDYIFVVNDEFLDKPLGGMMYIGSTKAQRRSSKCSFRMTISRVLCATNTLALAILCIFIM